jgi:hypothetical protein
MGYHVTEGAPYWIKEWIFATDPRREKIKVTVYDSEYKTSAAEVDATHARVVDWQAVDDG